MGFITRILFFAVCVLFTKGEVLTYSDGSVHAGFLVYCTDTTMTVEITKAQLDGRTVGTTNNRPYIISWKGIDSDSACIFDKVNATLSKDSSAIVVSASYPDGCGLTELSNADYIYYNQTIVVTYGVDSGLAKREEYDYYDVSCMRNRTTEEKLAGDAYNVTYRQDGNQKKSNTADYSFALTHADSDGKDQTQYSVGDYIHFELTLDTASSTVRSVLQKCWSTSDGSNSEYVLIRDRCALDEGTTIETPERLKTAFQTEAFRYLDMSHSAIFIECLVEVCLIKDLSGDCAACGSVPTVPTVPKKTPPTSRKRRDVGSEVASDEMVSGQMTLIKSPAFYIVDRDQTATHQQANQSQSALSGTNGTIVIILLATLVFVVAVAVIKKVFFPTVVAVSTVKGIDNKSLA